MVDTYELVDKVLGLPGAEQLQSQDVMQHVLQLALDISAGDLVSRICRKVQLDAAALSALLPLALQLRSLDAAAALCEAPAAKELPTASISACLEAVLGRACGSTVLQLGAQSRRPDPNWQIAARQAVAQQLLALPAAQGLPADAVAVLLDAAIGLLLEPLALDVCVLPAAEELQAEQLLAAMQRAVQHHLSKAVGRLVKQPAAAQICPEQLSGVMAEALELRLAPDAIVPLDSLLALQWPSMCNETYMGLLQLADQQQCLQWIPQLLKMQLADSIPAALLQQLLAGAVQAQVVAGVAALCAVPAAATMTAAVILPLLQVATVQSNNGGIVRMLASLPGAAAISSEAAQALVAAALQRRLAVNAEKLLRWLPSVR
jgi:hypothetical protein